MKRSGAPYSRLALLIAGTAGLGAALVLARTATFGVWLTNDSLRYLVATHNLLAGHGLTNVEGAAFTKWPPGYPLLLAVASLGVFDPYKVAGPLNAALFGLTIFVTGRYLHGRLRLRPLAAWAGLAIALAAPLASVAAWARSEPAFILLVVLALIRTDEYLAEGRAASLAWAALFAALAWQTRYVGVAVPVAVGLALLLQPGATRWQRVLRASFVWLVAALLMAPWMARNYLLAIGGRPYTLEETVKVLGRGHPTHGRPYPLDEVLAEIGAGFGSWTPFGSSPLGWPSLALLAVAAVALVWAGSRLGRGPRMPRASCGWRTFSVWGGFALAYLVLLIVAIAHGNTGYGLLERFLAPVYVPGLVVVVFMVDRLLGPDRGGKRSGGAGVLSGLGRFGLGGASLPGVVVAAGLALWLAANADRSLSEILRANRGEMDLKYSGPRWVESETLRYLRDNPIDGRVYSNNALLVLMYNGGNATYRQKLNNGDLWRPSEPPQDGDTVVWFRDPWGRGRGGGDLLASPGLTLLTELADGLIFRIANRRPAFDVELAGKTPTNPYRAARAAIAAGDFGAPVRPAPGADGGASEGGAFDLYLHDGTLAYLKEPCAAGDTAARFFLHVFPADPAELPARRREYGFDNRDFRFEDFGIRFDSRWGRTCLALVRLPGYGIASLRTGQFVSGAGAVWKAEIEHP